MSHSHLYKRRNRAAKKLFQAIKDNSASTVGKLLSKGVNIRSRNSETMTFLHMNAEMGDNSAITRHLIRAGCNINATEREGNTPLHVAICKNSQRVARCLVQAGADVQVQNSQGETPLHQAAACGDEEMVTRFLDLGVDPNVRNKHGHTPLHRLQHARGECRLIILRTFLERGCNINIPDNRGRTPFHFTVMDGDLYLTRLCLDHGADAMKANDDGLTALHYAAINNNCTPLQCVLDMDGTDVDQKTGNGMTALLVACSSSQCLRLENIRLLLARGAGINAADDEGSTALLHLVIGNPNNEESEVRSRAMRLLLRLGADVKITEERGLTVLDQAAVNNERGMVKVILEHVALLEEVQPSKRGLMDYCEQETIDEHPEITVYYERCRAELRVMQESKIYGTTVTFFNVLSNDVDVVAGYARNDELLDAFAERDFKLRFPIYSALLQHKLHEGLKRLELVTKAAIMLSDALQFADPCHIALHKILGYLDDEDLMNTVYQNDTSFQANPETAGCEACEMSVTRMRYHQ